MKKLLLITIALLALSRSNAQQGNLGMWELFSETYPMPPEYKTVSVDQYGAYTVSAAINPIKHTSHFPEQKCGPLKLFALNFIMGNPYRWDINVNGNIFPFDIEITKDYNTIITGAFIDSFHIGNYAYQSQPFLASSFVMSVNIFGQVNWVKVLNDSVYNTIATSATSLESGNIILTALTNDIESTIWKINAKTGNTIATKVFNEVRTLSSVVAESNHLYIAGSAGDLAHIDTFTIGTPLNTGYVNFLAKLDTNFQTLNLKCKPYITFDFTSNVLVNPSSKNIIWGHYFASPNQQFLQGFEIFDTHDDLIKHYETTNINSMVEFNNRLMIPNIKTGMFYVLQKHQNNYYGYDLSGANVDSTLLIENSAAFIYDVGSDSTNGYTTVGVFYGDSLKTNVNVIYNPLADSTNYQNFLSHYFEFFSGISNQQNFNAKVFPNPANDIITIDLEGIEKIEIYTLQGKLIDEQFNKNIISVDQLPTGMYLLKASTLNKNYVAKFIKK